jgi:ribose transport system substrate-binding protein
LEEKMNKSRIRWLLVAMASLLVAVSIGACGSSDDSTSSGGTEATGAETTAEESGGSDIQAEAEELVAKWETPPPKVPEALPLKDTNIPKGKTVAFLGCGAATCEEYYPPIEEAAKALGWSSKMYQGSIEPNKQVGFLEEIVASKPDVFIACCIAPSLGKKYFNELKANGTVTFMCCTAEPGTEGIDKLTSLPSDKLQSGQALADFMIAEKGEDLNVLYVNSQDFEVSAEYFEGLEKEIKRLCPDCPVDTVEVGVEEIGKPSIPTTVVGYLRSHPDVNFVGTLFSPLLTGVPAAMAAASINEVSIGATAQDELSLKAVAEGKENWKAVQNFGKEFGLWGVNFAVRTIQGEETSDETRTPEVLVTEKNAEAVLSDDDQWVIPDALEQYEALWGLK